MNAPDMRARLAGSVHVLTTLTRRVRPDGTLLESGDETALEGIIRDLTRVLSASRMHGLSINARGAADVVAALDAPLRKAPSAPLEATLTRVDALLAQPKPHAVRPEALAELDRQTEIEEAATGLRGGHGAWSPRTPSRPRSVIRIEATDRGFESGFTPSRYEGARWQASLAQYRTIEEAKAALHRSDNAWILVNADLEEGGVP